jgi:ribosome-associated protein
MPDLPDIDSLVAECRFEATRSSGSGGQNVNKVSTKVILLFNVNESRVLDNDQKSVFLSELHTRISKYGIFRISCGRERTQFGNRKLVIEKFIALIEKAFKPEIERIATKPTRSSEHRRLESKKAVADRKTARRRRFDDEIEI